jgi:hypothetical protein
VTPRAKIVYLAPTSRSDKLEGGRGRGVPALNDEGGRGKRMEIKKLSSFVKGHSRRALG